MITLSELIAVLGKDLNVLIVDENDNEYTLNNLPINLVNRIVQIILPIKDGIEIRLFGEVNEYILEDEKGNRYEYWTDGEYNIVMPDSDINMKWLN